MNPLWFGYMRMRSIGLVAVGVLMATLLQVEPASAVVSLSYSYGASTDAVGEGDNAMGGNGDADYIFPAMISGPIKNLIFTKCEDLNQHWDTIIDEHKIPGTQAHGFNYDIGDETTVLGVYKPTPGSGGSIYNKPDGSIPHRTFDKAKPFYLYVEPPGAGPLTDGDYCLTVVRGGGKYSRTQVYADIP